MDFMRKSLRSLRYVSGSKLAMNAPSIRERIASSGPALNSGTAKAQLLIILGFRNRTAVPEAQDDQELRLCGPDRKSTRLNSSHDQISYAVFCLKKKTKV